MPARPPTVERFRSGLQPSLDPGAASEPDNMSSGLKDSTSLQGPNTAEEQPLRSRLLTSPEEIGAVREFWEGQNRNPNAEPDFFALINGIRHASPAVLVIEKGGNLVGLLVGRISSGPFRIQIGYKSVRFGSIRTLSILHGGVLGCEDPAVAQAACRRLRGLLSEKAIDVIQLGSAATGSPLFAAFRSQPIMPCRDYLIDRQVHWSTDLPSTVDEVLQRLPKKRRNWIRSLSKVLERDFPGKVEFRTVREAGDVAAAIAQLEQVAAKTYQRQIGAGLSDSEEFRQRFDFEARKGWLRIFVMQIEARPVAFWVGTVYKNTFHSDFTGYDPEFRNYNVGTVIFMKMVDHLCREGIATFDFGLGDAFYKRRFGTKQWTEATVRIFAPTWRNMGRNLLQVAIEGGPRCLKSVLARTPALQRIKTAWRRRLVKQSPEGEESA